MKIRIQEGRNENENTGSQREEWGRIQQGVNESMLYILLWQKINILFCCRCKAWHIFWLVKTALASCLWGVSQRPTHYSLCNSLSRTSKMDLLDNWQDRGMAEWQQETKIKRQSRILETCKYAGKDMCWRQVVLIVNFEKIEEWMTDGGREHEVCGESLFRFYCWMGSCVHGGGAKNSWSEGGFKPPRKTIA